MRRDLRRRITGVLAIGMTCGLAVGAQVQIHPASGTQGGPIRIAVLSDHYKADQEGHFNNHVNNLVIAGLLNSPDYLAYQPDITVYRYFIPWTASSETPYSNFGFLDEAAHCSVAGWDASSTSESIFLATQGVSPFRTIVIGNSTDRAGCARDHWVYVTSGSFPSNVLRHEMGHGLGALYDEYASGALKTVDYLTAVGPLDDRNCSTRETPHWMSWGLSDVTNRAECQLYGQGIRHPSDTCLMAAVGSTFCGVCQRTLKERVNGLLSRPATPTNIRIIKAGFFSQPTPPQPPVVQPSQPVTLPGPRMVRLLVSIDRTTNAMVVRQATDVNGGYLADYERTGRYAYEVSEGGKPLALGYLSGDPFQVRTYPGSTQRHEVLTVPSASFVVSIPGETVQGLRVQGRAVQLSVYLLDPAVTDRVIPPAAFGALKQKNLVTPVAQLAPDVLRKMLQ